MEELHYSLSISSFRRYVLVNARERRKRAEDDKELAYVQAVPSDKYIWACHVAPGLSECGVSMVQISAQRT